MPILLFVILLWVLVACSNSSDPEEKWEISSSAVLLESSSDESSDSISSSAETYDKMILVAGSEALVAIGTNDKNAKITETPELRTILRYDYFMDSAMVSCEEFKAVMSPSKLAKSLECTSGEILTDITFYDAALFANKKSKLAKIDSVYDYTSALFDEDGHCTHLGGFLFYADRKGFRLPTEAEWIKAASASYGHFFSTSLMEWSNDYLGKLKDTTIINFAGAKNPNELGERVVKEFSIKTGSTKPSLFSRGDVYAVLSESRADYVGFRLALGIIENPVWMDNSGSTSSSPITIMAKPADLWDFSKTMEMKVAFRNDVTGNLTYIDYTTDEGTAVEIKDTIAVYHPEISPDGNKVAFCTGFEGLTSQSDLYVRDLDSTGSHLVKLNVKSAAIPRWTVLDNGDTAIIYVNNPGVNSNDATFLGNSTWQVTFSNGKFGTPKKLFDGAYHGGVSPDGNLAVSGARLLRARKNNKDAIWYNQEQACNVSLSKDSTLRTAFLDFGGKTGRAFVGKSYSTHQYILIADSSGKLIQSIQAPSGFTFDHSEWVVGKTNDNIVATLVNANGAHRRIALTNLSSQKRIDLVEGEELWHPCFWIKPRIKLPQSSSSAEVLPSSSSSGEADVESSSTDIPSSSSSIEPFELDLDSAGMYYNTSGVYPSADRWRYKMELLWAYKDSATVISLGSSRMENAVVPLLFSEPIFAVNLASSGNSIQGSYLFLEKYLYHHMKNLKVVIFDLDIDRWWCCDNSLLNNPYKHYVGYVYDANHNFWKDFFPPELYIQTYESPGVPTLANMFRASRGHNVSSQEGWKEPSVSHDSTWISSNPALFNQKIDMLKKIIKTCNERNIYVIGVLLPQNPGYKTTGSYGRYGILRSEAPQIIQDFKAISETYPNFILLDENRMGDHDYSGTEANDTDHLNNTGAKHLTHRIDSLIKTLDIDWTLQQ